MTDYISKLFSIFSIYFRFYYDLKAQRKLLKNTLGQEIKEIRSINDGSLTEIDFCKIEKKYAYFVPVVVTRGLSLLWGRRISLIERNTITYLGAVTGLFDDLIDEKEVSLPHIESLLLDPDESKANSAHEKFVVRLWNKALNGSTQPELIKSRAIQVFEAQAQSKHQTHDNISKDEVANITYTKGGTSILFYRSAFNEPTTETESIMLYTLGGIVQLENDIFDIYKDYNQGIKTLATIETDIKNLRLQYYNVVNSFFNQVLQLKLPIRNKILFIRYISIFISYGPVCLNFLEDTQTRYGTSFTINKYKRSDLICDMDTLRSKIKLVSTAITLKSSILAYNTN